MDTDYLTEMAYQCIVIANYACDMLKAELGAMCSDYKSEDEYLAAVLKYVKRIERKPHEYLDDNNYLDEIDVKTFKMKLKILREHTVKTMAIPIKNRGKTWEDELNS